MLPDPNVIAGQITAIEMLLRSEGWKMFAEHCQNTMARDTSSILDDYEPNTLLKASGRMQAIHGALAWPAQQLTALKNQLATRGHIKRVNDNG